MIVGALLNVRLTRIVGWIAYAVAATVAVATPTVYGYYRVAVERGILESNVRVTAQLITQRINHNPEMWRYELIRLNDLLEHTVPSQEERLEVRTIYDSARSMVTRHQPDTPLRWPVLTVEAPVYDSGAIAGYYVVDRSLHEVAQNTVLVALLALALGIASAIALRVLPLRALHRAERHLAHLAHNDVLTGLPNRASLHNRLVQAIARAQRSGRALGLLFVDVDRFKAINDSLGHDVGDRVLREVADRLRSGVRGGDTVARLGGDEFVIVLEDVDRPDNVAIAARALLHALEAPYALDGRGVRLTCSIGIAIYPRDAVEPERLLRAADLAMYDAKKRGRNSFRFCTAEMNSRADERMRLEESLRCALDNGEYALVYQPQCNPEGTRVVGMEALLRWHPPGEEVFMPSHFIDVLEDTGLIVPVGEWVLHTACAQAKAWVDRGLGPFTMSVNVSPLQFHSAGILGVVRHALEVSGLPAGLLVLEITERLLMEDSEKGLHKIEALREMGVHVAVDDFGTGYSSFRYLSRFAVTSLKVDRSFVHAMTADKRTAVIVATIVDLAHKLGLTVVAEGVETDAQLALLQQYGCDAVQGFVYSRPLEPEAAHAFALAREPAALLALAAV